MWAGLSWSAASRKTSRTASASPPPLTPPSSLRCGASSTSFTGSITASTTARRWSFPYWQPKTAERRGRHEADQGSRDRWHRSTRHHVASRYQAVLRTQVHVGTSRCRDAPPTRPFPSNEQEEHTNGSAHRLRNRLLRR